MKKGKAKAVVAVFVIAVLGIFGNSWLGGETWTSGVATGVDGWHAYVPSLAPQPQTSFAPFLIPLIMVSALIAVSLTGWVLNYLSSLAKDDVPGAPTDDV